VNFDFGNTMLVFKSKTEAQKGTELGNCSLICQDTVTESMQKDLLQL